MKSTDNDIFGDITQDYNDGEVDLLRSMHELVACLRWSLETFVPDVDGDELTDTYGENTCFIHEVCLNHIKNWDAICEELGLPRAVRPEVEGA